MDVYSFKANLNKTKCVGSFAHCGDLHDVASANAVLCRDDARHRVWPVFLLRFVGACCRVELTTTASDVVARVRVLVVTWPCCRAIEPHNSESVPSTVLFGEANKLRRCSFDKSTSNNNNNNNNNKTSQCKESNI